jgi:hypothetical protein
MSLITPAARQSFEHLFSAALRANIAVQPTDEVTVQPAAAPPAKGEQARTLVLLTCASLRFKLVAVFQVVNEALARAYLVSNDISTDPVEVLFERCNLSCGALNRELLPYMPHMGLSTPSKLNGLTSQVLAALKGEQVSHFAIRINGDHLLDVALSMRGHAKVDFVANVNVAMAETGELELL